MFQAVVVGVMVNHSLLVHKTPLQVYIHTTV